LPFTHSQPAPRRKRAPHPLLTMDACVVCTLPASVYCENDRALLCTDCDRRIHLSNAVRSQLAGQGCREANREG
jgi:hypothetical protein